MLVQKIVIIGGVAAGLKAASKARRCDPTAQITVVERGERVSYGACGMPYFVSGDVSDLNQLMMTPAGAVRNPAFFKNVKNVDVLTQTLATGIDREAKQVTVKNLISGEQTELPYDKLVIATGATPFKPPLPGIELANIRELWRPDDAAAVREGLERGKYNNAVIIGAGLVGVEMVEALKLWGVNVINNLQKHRLLTGGPLNLRGYHGIPVQRRPVKRREIAARHGGFCQHSLPTLL